MSETVFYNNRTLVGIGSVGIGTTNPSYKFVIDNGSTSSINTVIQASGITAGQTTSILLGKALTQANCATIVWNHVGDGLATNYLGIGYYNGDNKLNVTSGGNVGIAQTNPQYTLDVNGSIRYSSYAFRFTATVNSTVPITANGKITYSTADASFPYTTITSGGFRAPVAGFYFFSAMVMLDNNGTSTSMRCGIGVTSTDTATITYSGAGSMDTLTWFKITNTSEPTNSSLCNIPLNGVVYCAANDYVKVYACVGTANSTKTYSWANPVNYFSGYLISGV